MLALDRGAALDVHPWTPLHVIHLIVSRHDGTKVHKTVPDFVVTVVHVLSEKVPWWPLVKSTRHIYEHVLSKGVLEL